MPEPIHIPAGLTTDGLIGKRYLARFLDSLVIALLSVGGFWLNGYVFGGVGPAGVVLVALTNLLSALVAVLLYGSLLESSPWQATLGKRLMGLRVYDQQGGRMSFGQAFARNGLKEGPFILLQLIPSPIGGICVFGWLIVHIIVLHGSPVYQAIHDRIAKTWVAAPEETLQLRLS
jgi:uncharacterized RDD family membrane protein YckC